MNIEVYNISFSSDGAILDCRVLTNSVRGNLQIFADPIETQKAMAENKTIDLATRHISEMIEATKEVEENKYINLQEEIQTIKEQNKILEGAIADLGELIALNKGADDIG